MTAKKVFVTGAAGQTGTQTIKWLTHAGKNVDVYAGIHKGEERKQESVVKSFKCCPCVTEGANHKQLCDCFKDVQDLFIIPPSTEERVEVASNYIRAAKEANVKFVLLLSVQGAGEENYLWGKQFAEIERRLTESGVNSWCIMRTPFYMQNLLLYKTQIKQGHLPLPTGEGKFAPIDVSDVGKLATWILNDCEMHKGKIYNCTGCETLNGTSMAKIFSEVCSRDVKFRDIDPDEARRILKSQDVPDVEIQSLMEFYEQVKKGKFSTITGDFEKICGTPPKSMRDWVTEIKSECTQ